MPIHLDWFLPTSGDSRSDATVTEAVDAVFGTPDGAGGSDEGRAPTPDYLGQIARAAEQQGVEALLTPTSTDCQDAWITAAALARETQRLKFLVAMRPGLISPTLAAQMAATLQRFSGNRALLNVVTGGEDIEQRRFGDDVDKDGRYARAGEFMHVFRRLFEGETVTFHGEHLWVDGAVVPDPPQRPDLYFAGSSAAAIDVAAQHADVYLTWGEPPAMVADKIDRVRDAAAARGRELEFGIRLHVISRSTSDEAWAVADRLLAGLDPERIRAAQERQRLSQSEGQRRMSALHGGRADQLLVAPNLWAGIGLVRGGAGTALVGSHAEVADRIEEYHALGLDHFILSGYPHLEEVYRLGEGLRPELDRRGLLDGGAAPVAVRVA